MGMKHTGAQQDLSKCLDGLYWAVYRRQWRLKGLWNHRHEFRGTPRAFEYYARAVKLIREIKKLQRIIFEVRHILSTCY